MLKKKKKDTSGKWKHNTASSCNAISIPGEMKLKANLLKETRKSHFISIQDRMDKELSKLLNVLNKFISKYIAEKP